MVDRSRIILIFFESWLARGGSLSTYKDFQQQFLLVLFFSLQIIVVLPRKEGVLLALSAPVSSQRSIQPQLIRRRYHIPVFCQDIFLIFIHFYFPL